MTDLIVEGTICKILSQPSVINQPRMFETRPSLCSQQLSGKRLVPSCSAQSHVGSFFSEAKGRLGVTMCLWKVVYCFRLFFRVCVRVLFGSVFWCVSSNCISTPVVLTPCFLPLCCSSLFSSCCVFSPSVYRVWEPVQGAMLLLQNLDSNFEVVDVLNWPISVCEEAKDGQGI